MTTEPTDDEIAVLREELKVCRDCAKTSDDWFEKACKLMNVADANELMFVLRALQSRKAVTVEALRNWYAKQTGDVFVTPTRFAEAIVSTFALSESLCLVCGAKAPCMTEADLKPNDPGVPCTFDPECVRRAFENGRQSALSEQQGAPVSYAKRDDLCVRLGALYRHIKGLDSGSGDAKLLSDVIDFMAALSAPRAEQGAQTLTDRDRAHIETMRGYVKDAGSGLNQFWANIAIDILDRIAPQGSAPTSDAQENGNG